MTIQIIAVSKELIEYRTANAAERFLVGKLPRCRFQAWLGIMAYVTSCGVIRPVCRFGF